MSFRRVTRAVDVPPFSRATALALATVIGILLAPLVWRWWQTPRTRTAPAHATPWWGWAGVLLLAASWLVAWTRLPAFAEIQRYTFTPLWLGYIVVINAWSYRRNGRCLIRDRPRYFVALFPLSAIFWWYFEYLNRFVHNWHYVGVDNLSAGQYVLEASVPFATVLPAVLSTAEWLATFPRVQLAFARWHPVRWANTPIVTWGSLSFGIAGLIAVGRWPQYCYPLVWMAPFALLCALQALPRRRPLCQALARGDWRPVVLAAMAGLVCGFFWEMWNYASLARWVYTVPYMNGWRVFEMPLMGYAGYIPFGLACAAIADLAGCGTDGNGVRLRDAVAPDTPDR